MKGSLVIDNVGDAIHSKSGEVIMPEAPDLEVIKDFLNLHVQGQSIESATILRPTVLRSLAGDFPADVQGRTFGSFQRRGKFLLGEISGGRWLVVNPMLTGAFQYCEAKERVQKKTCFTLSLDGDNELRYLDDRQMGMVYYISDDQMGQVPRLHEQGPDVLDGTSFEEFQERLKRFHGEIKGVLTRGAFLSGIGNAYSDEILFAAGLSPFRKARSLSTEEQSRLFQQSRAVVEEAIEVLQERMGNDIHIKIRDFLKVHRKGGQPCPSCGANISQLNANQRITSYCRHCQPGMLIKN
ncbi:MAG: Fpg/Nei family DNA glycosylase [Chloroflexi bacterium]|nr:Fpg/Nei family DNA glycosylase [Chloroflexota bacterium]